MAYVTIPKDLSKVQSKVLFGLTKRQVICFGAAALIGVPLFFLAKGALGTTTAALCMILVMLPFFLFAMYEKNGQPLEVFLLLLLPQYAGGGDHLSAGSPPGPVPSGHRPGGQRPPQFENGPGPGP